MRPIVVMVSIAIAHIAFSYCAYGSKFFGLALPYGAIMVLWLGASTIAAGIGYSKAAGKMRWFATVAHRRHLFAIAAAAVSLFLGVCWVFNSFGT